MSNSNSNYGVVRNFWDFSFGKRLLKGFDFRVMNLINKCLENRIRMGLKKKKGGGLRE